MHDKCFGEYRAMNREMTYVEICAFKPWKRQLSLFAHIVWFVGPYAHAACCHQKRRGKGCSTAAHSLICAHIRRHIVQFIKCPPICLCVCICVSVYLCVCVLKKTRALCGYV
jgi:hypothetical protein